jgi:hypothetical protein
VRRIDESVVVILVRDQLRFELTVVDPDVGTLLCLVSIELESVWSSVSHRTSILMPSPVSASTFWEMIFRTITLL